MSTPNDGGPAFPLAMRPGATNILGMTLRDYFAGQALPAKITDVEAFNNQALKSGSNIRITPENVAASCYKYADAMLKAREGKQ